MSKFKLLKYEILKYLLSYLFKQIRYSFWTIIMQKQNYSIMERNNEIKKKELSQVGSNHRPFG